jgi:hypothetical protein
VVDWPGVVPVGEAVCGGLELPHATTSAETATSVATGIVARAMRRIRNRNFVMMTTSGGRGVEVTFGHRRPHASKSNLPPHAPRRQPPKVWYPLTAQRDAGSCVDPAAQPDHTRDAGKRERTTTSSGSRPTPGSVRPR